MPVASDVRLGHGVEILHPDLVNCYGCDIGDGTRVGPFVEIQKGVSIGRGCKISSHTFICEGVTIGDHVFIGHGVMFTNDRHPSVDASQWVLERTIVGHRVAIGSGAVILCGLTIGDDVTIGAGAVVTRDVPPASLVRGEPARVRVRASARDHLA